VKEIAVRAASGAVYVALVLGAAWLGPWATWFLFLLVAVMAAREWHKLYWREGGSSMSPSVSMAIIAVAYGLGPTLLGMTDNMTSLPWTAGTLVSGMIWFAWQEADKARAMRYLLSLVGYLAIPFLCATWLVQISHTLFIGFMLMLWANDTGAYLVGRAIGRNKLMPSVSPGKTWEGFFGGLVITLVAAWVVARGIDEALSPTSWLIASPFVVVPCTVGDLFESFMKRKAGVKDSGTIMPGHGGVLDRFDGYLLAAPVMAMLAWLMA